jgi:hypothetical protein
MKCVILANMTTHSHSWGWILFCILSFVLPVNAIAESRVDHLLSIGDFTVQTVLHKNSQPRSFITATIEKVRTWRKGPLLRMVKRGKGHFDRFKNVNLITEIVFHIEDDFVIIHRSSTLLLDDSGKILASFEKFYDYIIKEATWRRTDGERNILDEQTFSFDGKICDEESLIVFLPPFLKNPQKPSPPYFYLLTNEPHLYKTRLDWKGEEHLLFPRGNIPALKVKLTGEVGVLDNILDRFVPATFIWFRQSPPHDWLQYQGFESNYRSAYVRSFIEDPPLEHNSGQPPDR